MAKFKWKRDYLSRKQPVQFESSEGVRQPRALLQARYCNRELENDRAYGMRQVNGRIYDICNQGSSNGGYKWKINIVLMIFPRLSICRYDPL